MNSLSSTLGRCWLTLSSLPEAAWTLETNISIPALLPGIMLHADPYELVG